MQAQAHVEVRVHCIDPLFDARSSTTVSVPENATSLPLSLHDSTATGRPLVPPHCQSNRNRTVTVENAAADAEHAAVGKGKGWIPRCCAPK